MPCRKPGIPTTYGRGNATLNSLTFCSSLTLGLILHHEHGDVVILLGSFAKVFHRFDEFGVQFGAPGRGVETKKLHQRLLVEKLALRIGRLGKTVTE